VIKKLSRLTSLTETEVKIFLFVISMICLGGGVKYYKSLPAYEAKKFSYAKEDSLFAYFKNQEIDTALIESKTLFRNEKSFIAKGNEKNPYVKKTVTGKQNLNTASVTQLTTLPGIGFKTAEQIIAYRKRVGIIKSLDELLNIKGIGEKKLSKLQPFITFE